MRRSPFFIVPIVALATFIALSAFVGRRHFGPHYGWHRHHYCDDGHRYNNRFDENPPTPNRTPITDSASL